MNKEESPKVLTASPKVASRSGPARMLQNVSFRVLTEYEAIALLDNHVQTREPIQVAIANAHTLNTARNNDRYLLLLKRFTVLNDGIGVDLASLMRYGQRFPANLNGTDFLPAYLSQTSRKLRVFMLGAKPKVVEKAFDEARRRFPNHDWLGFRDGYFRSEDEVAVCESIRDARIDLLLVAMGNPLQEYWIDRCAAQTGATVSVGVGALFDFLSGTVNRAPNWARKLKAEWVYRLLQEPKRLWRRYLIGNLTFFWFSFKEKA